MFLQDCSYAHIAAQASTGVKAGKGVLYAVTVNTTAAGTITIYDDTAAVAANVIAIIKASVAEQTFVYGIEVTRGIFVVTAAASDLTVSYQ